MSSNQFETVSVTETQMSHVQQFSSPHFYEVLARCKQASLAYHQCDVAVLALKIDELPNDGEGPYQRECFEPSNKIKGKFAGSTPEYAVPHQDHANLWSAPDPFQGYSLSSFPEGLLNWLELRANTQGDEELGSYLKGLSTAEKAFLAAVKHRAGFPILIEDGREALVSLYSMADECPFTNNSLILNRLAFQTACSETVCMRFAGKIDDFETWHARFSEVARLLPALWLDDGQVASTLWGHYACSKFGMGWNQIWSFRQVSSVTESVQNYCLSWAFGATSPTDLATARDFVESAYRSLLDEIIDELAQNHVRQDNAHQLVKMLPRELQNLPWEISQTNPTDGFISSLPEAVSGDCSEFWKALQAFSNLQFNVSGFQLPAETFCSISQEAESSVLLANLSSQATGSRSQLIQLFLTGLLFDVVASIRLLDTDMTPSQSRAKRQARWDAAVAGFNELAKVFDLTQWSAEQLQFLRNDLESRAESSTYPQTILSEIR